MAEPKAPNTMLRALRERTASATAPGEHLSRQELADRVNVHVGQCTRRPEHSTPTTSASSNAG